MLSHSVEIANVCWVTPGVSPADLIRQSDLGDEAFTLRRIFLSMLGRLPRESELGAVGGPEALVQSILNSSEFRDREGFALAAYHSLFARDLDFSAWLAAVEDLASSRKSRAQLVEEWQRSPECRAVSACASAAPDDVIRKASGKFQAQEEQRQARLLLYYCLLQRAPNASDANDPSDVIHSVIDKARASQLN